MFVCFFSREPDGAINYWNISIFILKVVKEVDGLIYYLDATCVCTQTEPSFRCLKAHCNLEPEKVYFNNLWQREEAPLCNTHPLDNEFYELEAMLKATPEVLPPILIMLVYNAPGKTDGSSSSDSDEAEPHRTEMHDGSPKDFHSPADVLHRLQNVQNPWMVRTVKLL